MPKTPEQYKQEKAAKKKQIREIALELFSHESFQAVSISKIAKKVGMSKGLFYTYFESKEKLLEEILQAGFDKIIDVFKEEGFKIETKEDFTKMINSNFEMLIEEPHFWKLYMNLALQPASQKYFSEHIMEALQIYMTEMIGYFTAKGCKNPQAEAMVLGALLDGVSIGYSIQPDMYPLNDIKQIIIKRFA